MRTPSLRCLSCGGPYSEGDLECPSCGRPPASLMLGSVLAGRYELRQKLGEGSMGTVFKAMDRSLDDVTAVKVMKREFLADPDAVRRFQGEVKLALRVTHPNVCRIHHYGEHCGLRFLTMELIDGTDLRTLLGRGAPDPAAAFDLAIQVAEGLAAIHAQGIVHRDLKPENLVQDARGVVKVMDFGIARAEQATTLTQAGTLMGTVEYMSPEQVQGLRADARSDVYALGVLVFELFTGRLPFDGAPESIMQRHLREAPPLDDPRLPDPLRPVLARALAKPAGQRQAHAGEVADELRQAQAAWSEAGAPPAALAAAEVRASGLPRSAPALTAAEAGAGTPGAATEVPSRPGSGSPAAALVALGVLALSASVGLLTIWLTSRPGAPAPATARPSPAARLSGSVVASSAPAPSTAPATRPAVATAAPATLAPAARPGAPTPALPAATLPPASHEPVPAATPGPAAAEERAPAPRRGEQVAPAAALPAPEPRPRAWLGLRLGPLESLTGIPRPVAEVVQVASDSPAKAAGVQAGDYVVSIDGVPLRRVGDLDAYLDGKGPGATVELELFPPEAAVTPRLAFRGRRVVPVKLGGRSP